jgi:mannonate dehydratase
VERLRRLAAGMAPGFKVLLLAFDFCRDGQGVEDCGGSTFHTPNAYAERLARRQADTFVWAASIHPYRADAVAELDWAVERGAVAMKWLPSAQNIDPADARCDAFYEALARHDLPLIVHCGEEKTARAAGLQHLGNPLRLRRALEHGVRVVVAHCATLGLDADLERDGRSVASFDLFARLMDEPRYEALLFGDISAITLVNRAGRVRALLAREAWHGRLLNGSDYPLPGILPFFAPEQFAALGLLPPKAVPVLNAIQQYNPLLFDFVLKRHLDDGGRRFPVGMFETRRFFERKT